MRYSAYWTWLNMRGSTLNKQPDHYGELINEKEIKPIKKIDGNEMQKDDPRVTQAMARHLDFENKRKGNK